MKHDCKYEKVIEIIDKRLDKIDTKLDSLLKFRWQITGVASIIGGILAFVANKIF